MKPKPFLAFVLILILFFLPRPSLAGDEEARRSDTLEFGIGVVGRHSYAEDCQEAIHNRIGSVDPKGWTHQLHDEPVFNLFFERK